MRKSFRCNTCGFAVHVLIPKDLRFAQDLCERVPVIESGASGHAQIRSSEKQKSQQGSWRRE